MSALEWFVINTLETFVFVSFAAFFLKKDFSPYLPTVAVAFLFTIERVLDANELITIVAGFLIYFSVLKLVSGDSPGIEILKTVSVLLFYAVVVDTAIYVVIKLVAGMDITAIQSDFNKYFLLTLCSAIIKALLLYFIIGIRRSRQ